MRLSSSQSVRVKVTNVGNRRCHTSVEIQAPGFDIGTTNTTAERDLTQGQATDIIWVIKPKELGEFTVAIRTPFEGFAYGVDVTRFGLNAEAFELLAYIGPAIGCLLSLPWLLDVLKLLLPSHASSHEKPRRRKQVQRTSPGREEEAEPRVH
jgi:hypothetical protein